MNILPRILRHRRVAFLSIVWVVLPAIAAVLIIFLREPNDEEIVAKLDKWRVRVQRNLNNGWDVEVRRYTFERELPNPHLGKLPSPAKIIRHINRLENIESLWLNDTGISKDDFSRLQGLNSLVHFRLMESFRLDNETLREIGAMPRLETLAIDSSEISSNGLRVFRNSTQLRRLKLDIRLDDAGLAHFSGCEALEEVDLSSTGGNVLSGEGLKWLANARNLRILRLGGCPITNKGAASLRQLNSIEELPISSVEFNDDGMQHLAHLTNLRFLFLGGPGSRITDAGVEHLAQLRSLEALSLTDTQITDVSLQHLSQIASLKGLGLVGTPITNEGLKHLEALPSLKTLVLNRTDIDDGAVEYLRSFPALERVTVGNTKMTEEGRSALENSREGLEVTWDRVWRLKEAI